MKSFLGVIGVVWCVGMVALFNVAWALRNRAAWARRTVEFLKQFTKERKDYAILVWAISGDVVLTLLLIGFLIRALS